MEIKESKLYLTLITLQNTLEKYKNLNIEIENFDIGERLPHVQRKRFHQILEEQKKMPKEILASAKIIRDLTSQKQLSDKEISDCNLIFLQIAILIIEVFNISPRISKLHAYWLIQFCTIRQTLLLSARVFFKWVFTQGKGCPLYSKSELHNKLMDEHQSYDEKIWQSFFEGKASSPYFEKFAEKFLSYDIAALYLPNDVFPYFAPFYNLELMCGIPFKYFPDIDKDLHQIHENYSMNIISGKLAELGLCFEITKEDLISVCTYPLVVRSFKGFDETYHAKFWRGPTKIIYHEKILSRKDKSSVFP